MRRRVIRRPTLLCWLVLGALSWSTAASSAVPPSDQPAARLGDVHTTPGTVELTLYADGLAAGVPLEPASVTVSVGGHTLRATAQPVTATSTAGTPLREVVLAMDLSGSMEGTGIAAARAAAAQFVTRLPADVRVGLLTFADSASLRVPPTDDHNAVLAAIADVRAGGGTALYDGITAAAAALGPPVPGTVRRLLILSDGDDTSSQHTLENALHALTGGKIAADVVAFRLPGSSDVLARIAVSSGGRALPADRVSDLTAAFAQAATIFQQQLRLTIAVPPLFAERTEKLRVSVTAGNWILTASSTVRLPALPGTTPGPSQPVAAQPAITARPGPSSAVVAAIVFVSLLGLLLLTFLVPAFQAERLRKRARLGEVGRYRVLGAVPASTPGTPRPGDAGPTRSGGMTGAAFAAIDRAVRARGQRSRLAEELSRAGMRLRPEEWVVLQMAIVVAGAAVGGLLARLVGVVGGAVLGWAGTRIFLRRRTQQRVDRFAEQLPDTLQLVAGALRTGFSLNQALAGVVREGNEPIAGEFARTLSEIRLGAEVEDALDDAATRMRCVDLHWVVMAVRISREVGGNLAEVVTTVVQTMRQRAELRGQVRVLSAEGRISARILTAMPFVVAGGLALLRRGYLAPLVQEPLGIAMLIIGASLLLLGTFWLSRIVKLKV